MTSPAATSAPRLDVSADVPAVAVSRPSRTSVTVSAATVDTVEAVCSPLLVVSQATNGVSVACAGAAPNNRSPPTLTSTAVRCFPTMCLPSAILHWAAPCQRGGTQTEARLNRSLDLTLAHASRHLRRVSYPQAVPGARVSPHTCMIDEVEAGCGWTLGGVDAPGRAVGVQGLQLPVRILRERDGGVAAHPEVGLVDDDAPGVHRDGPQRAVAVVAVQVGADEVGNRLPAVDEPSGDRAPLPRGLVLVHRRHVVGRFGAGELLRA